jgi:hypothetical protein
MIPDKLQLTQMPVVSNPFLSLGLYFIAAKQKFICIAAKNKINAFFIFPPHVKLII